MNSRGDGRGEVGTLLRPSEYSPVDEFWPHVELYLTQAARAIRTDKAEDISRVGDLSNRMNWYAVVYKACGGHPRNSREVYNRFSLFLLNDLEAHVLQPLLERKTFRGSNSLSLCQQFVMHCKAFRSFRRVALSCFSYLEQHHIPKFQLDPLNVLCLKMFYVVVFEPIKKSLLDETIGLSNPVRMEYQNGVAMSPACVAMQEVLAFVVELFSTLSTTSGKTPYMKDSEPKTDEIFNFELSEGNNVSILERLSALIQSEATSAEKVSNLKGGEKVASSEEKEVPLDAQSRALQEICAMRQRIKSRSSTYLQAGMAGVANHIFRDSSAEVAAAESTRMCIVETNKPFYVLVFLNFGMRYVLHAEAHYRDQRTLRLSRAEGLCDYIPWVRKCCDVEWSLVKNLNAPLLYEALRERIYHVLLVELHQQVILDDDFGFRAQLNAWDLQDGRNFNTLLKPFSQMADGGVAPAVGFSVGVNIPCARLAEDELANKVKEFVMIFINTRDEACGALLATELSDKVMEDLTLLFCSYFAQLKEESLPQAQTWPSLRKEQKPAGNLRVNADKKRHLGGGGGGATSTASRPHPDAAMTLIDAIVDLVIRYENLICKQFGGYVPMQVELRNALRWFLHPNNWSQLLTATPALAGRTANAFSASHNGTTREKILALLNRLLELRGDREIQVPQLFASYCDQLLRWEVRSVTESDATTNRADYVVKLVSLMDDKDIFLEHYKLNLMCRLLLLLPSQLNLDAERMMFRKLQQIFGRTLTHNLEGMLRDHETSMSVSEEFHQTHAHQSLSSKLRVQVLTSVHWQMCRAVQLKPVPSLAQAIEAFTEYYTGLHPSRTLRWIHTLGTATLHAVFPKGVKEVIANTMQSNILILVSDACKIKRGVSDDQESDTDPKTSSHQRSISGASIAAGMGMNFNDLRVHLSSLVFHKVYNLLVRADPLTHSAAGGSSDSGGNAVAASNATLRPEDEFMLNVGYTHKMRKFRLPIAHIRNVQGTKGGGHADIEGEDGVSLTKVVEDTRRLHVDAAIIRIMKSRRSLRYQELLDATAQQLSRLFVPTARLLKVQLEGLVGRGFLQRDETDASVFHYVS